MIGILYCGKELGIFRGCSPPFNVVVAIILN